MAIGRIGGVSGGDTILETYRYNASGGETSLSGADASGKTLVYPANYEAVFLNGVRLARGLDYSATTGNSITGLAALAAGDVVEIAVLQSLDVVQVDYADVRFAAEEPSNPVNGTVWIDSDATVDVENFIANSVVTAKGQVIGASASSTPAASGTPSRNGLPLVSDSSAGAGVAFTDTLRDGLTLLSDTQESRITVRGDGQVASTSIERYSTNTSPTILQFLKGRGSVASPTVVSDGDALAFVRFFGYDGGTFREAARITATVDGTPGASDMPGRLSFLTTAGGSSSPTERMRITNSGRIQIPAGGILEAPISTNAQTTSYTLVLGDAGRLVEINNAGATTLTIPADASVNFPVGTKIDVLQTGAGQVTIAGSGFTPNATPGLKISAQWGAATLIKRGTNSWVVIGNLSA